MKKEWTRPKLISLYRGMPEETVIAGCKTNDPEVSGEGTTQYPGCQVSACAGVLGS